ncbi:MAG: beta strand repeat-containing protein, partial [Planctomycetota bacterium]
MVYAGENRYVSNNNDAGAGSLRQALLDSRSGSSVTFDPAFFLPTAQRQILLQSDLPVVSLDIAIDASNAGVSLDDGAFLPASGLLVFTGNGASVMGIHFNGSGRDAIAITGGYTAVGGSGAGEGNVFTGITRYAIHYASTSAGTTTVRGNHIGVNKSFADGNNGDHGIYVNGTGSITIGGTSTGAAAPSINEGNFIGYHDAGSKAAILVQDGSPVILGNYIGTNRAGIFLGNDNAVAIGANADGVVLGAATYGQGNVIGQNNDIAVWFEASGGSHFIRGNYIGTTYDAGVWRDLEPGNHGLLINGTGSLTVGGVNTGGTGPTSLNEGNYFAFHSNGALASMFIADGSPVIKGNYIGTNRVGANLGNDIGVYISSGTDGLSFGGTGYGEGNVLGFSTNYQMWFLCNTGSHTIKGNFIGTTYDAGTWRDLGPTNHGINIDGSGTLAIGGVCTGGTGPQSLNEGNYIAFHDTAAKAGIYIHSGSHSIKGNFLGTNRAGADLGNTYGIQMAAGSMNTTIGGTAYGEGNVLGGSDGYQIYYQSTAGGTSVIKGNFIGVTHDAGVWRDLGAADHGIYANGTSTLTIGGTCTGGVGPQGIHEGNYIAFHNTAGKAGIFVSQGIPGIKGNYIGSNRAGANLGNAYGINLSDAVGNIVVGSATYGQGNVIGFSANTGIYHNCDAGSQTIIGNYIGVTHDHILGGPNSWLALTQTNGIELADLNGSTLTVGGAAAGEGNYIGCGTYGIVAVTKTHLNVYGNTIGTDNTHTLDFGTTSNSIYIALTAGNTMTIGGAGAGQGNLIAYSDGYAIRAESALFNVETLVVAGNYIGTDATGRNLGGGGSTGGIYADSGYTVTVGGATSAHGNVIGGTLGTQGIYLASGLTSAVIQNNFVGVTRDGTSLSAGSATGIFVASDSTITGNTVGNFTGEGIQLGAGSHTLKSNLIGTHASGAAHGNGTGVRILAAAGSVAIGGTGAGEGNRINNNTTYGIRNDSADVGHTIRSNLIGVAEGGAAAPNGTASLYTTTGTIAFGNTSGRRNNIHGVEGQKAIHQTGGTLAFAGVNYVSGDMLSTGGTSTVANQLVLTGSVTGFFSGGLGFTTITLIGSRPQTLGAINNFFSLQYNGTSYHNMTGYSTNFLTVQSGMAVVKNGTLTMKSGDPFGINVGAAVGKTAVLSFDNATLTSTAPGTTRHAININARGDLRATKTVFNSLWNKGIVFATGSRLGGNTTFDNGTANFRHVTFDNVTADCVAMDVSALTAADAGSFPDLLRDIRFNGNVGATNVKSGASTPRIDFSVTTGNFGTIGTDGKSAEDDAAGVINWFIGVFVDTVTDVDDGNTASVAALTAAPGADGKISLREAIKAVNNNVDENVIVFSPTVFPVSAQGKITVGSALPTLTHALTRVDGRNAGVTLDGTGLAGGESGLTFNATGCDIKGLRITNFPGSGILVSGGSLQVGGPGSDDGLVIGGVLDGIRFQSAAATASSVRGCWIGVNKSGQDLGSTGHGIYVNGSAPLTIGGSASGEGNHIGFHDSVGMAGLYVNDGSVTLQGNRIGTSSTGDRWGNATGVWLAAGADAVVLGGTQSGEGNSIAGNTGTGLRVASTYAVGSGTQVLGNMIGRRTDGTPVSHANGGHGIQIDAGAGLVTLGSASEKAPNQIAGSKGQQALEQSGGTLNFAGTVSVDGAMTFAG